MGQAAAEPTADGVTQEAWHPEVGDMIMLLSTASRRPDFEPVTSRGGQEGPCRDVPLAAQAS